MKFPPIVEVAYQCASSLATAIAGPAASTAANKADSILYVMALLLHHRWNAWTRRLPVLELSIREGCVDAT
jgi:hypothetical protein